MKMQKLKDLAQRVPRVKGQQRLIAAAYDKKGNLLAVAGNSYIKTHPRQAKYAKKVNLPLKEYLHAEIAALVKCRETPHTIYVCRVNASGALVEASPCPVCRLAMQEAGVKVCVSSHSESGVIVDYLE